MTRTSPGIARFAPGTALADFIGALPGDGAVIVIPDHDMRTILAARIREAKGDGAQNYWFVLLSEASLADIQADAIRHDLPVLKAPPLRAHESEAPGARRGAHSTRDLRRLSVPPADGERRAPLKT